VSKPTTYRRIALDTLERPASDLGLHIDRQPASRSRLDASASPSRSARCRAHLPPSTAWPPRCSNPLADPTARAGPNAPDIAAQALYAAEREWARNPEDILRRRTTLALRGLADAELTRRVEQLIGRHGEPLLAARP
jgi:glycerol-3-phosphate dehydrogenase